MAAPSLKDLEVLEKFATKLCVPLFAVASVLQPPEAGLMPRWTVASLSWLVTSVFPSHAGSLAIAVLATAALWGLFWAGCCILLLWVLLWIGLFLIDYSWLDWLRPLLLPGASIAFISMGTLALCKIPALQGFGIRDPVPQLQLFWELGFFTYGLWCGQVSEAQAS